MSYYNYVELSHIKKIIAKIKKISAKSFTYTILYKIKKIKTKTGLL